MIQEIAVHERVYQRAVRWVKCFTDSERWQVKVVALSLLVCFVCAFPDYGLYGEGSKSPETWRVVNQQIRSPFTAIPASELPPPSSNEAKRVFRLFMPLVGHVLGLDRGGLLVVQNLMGVLFLWVVIALVYKITEDRVASAFFILGVSLTFPSLWFFNSFSTNLDGPGYLLLAASLLVPDVIGCFCLLFLASFVDERVFACFGFFVIWWKLNSSVPDDWTWRRILAVDRYMLTAVAVVVIHGVIRYYLIVGRGFHLPTGDAAGVGFANVRHSWSVFSPSIIAPFKGLSLYVVLAGVVTAMRRNWAVLFSVGVISIAVMLQAFAVGDHTRSLAYGFPLIVLSVKVLRELEPCLDLRRMSALIASLCLLVPSFNVTGGVVSWFTPVFPKVIRWLW